MPYESDDCLSRHYQTGAPELGQEIDQLLAMSVPADSPNLPLYREMLLTVVRMAQADRNRWDAKIMLQTLREMENAFCGLERFKRQRKVTVFGSARTPSDHPLYALARELGQRLASQELMAITGAGGGIMAAAHEGAGFDHSLGFNITLPFEQHANPVVDHSSHLLTFHFFFLRKLFFVKEADALVLFPGGFGTLDEALEVLTLVQTGKSPMVPIVLVDAPGGEYWQSLLQFMSSQLGEQRYILPSDLKLMRLVHSAEDAVREITDFYRNYHSSRWLKDLFAIRLQRPLNPVAIEQLHQQFGELSRDGRFLQLPYCSLDQDEPEFCHLTRLTFPFTAHDQGRLRELIDFTNQPQNWLAG